MNKFEQLFAEYPCTLTDQSVKAEVENILANHFIENNNAEVWKQCLHSIDLTTLNGDDTTEKVETMAQRVNEFEDNFPGIPNVAAMCVVAQPALQNSIFLWASLLMLPRNWSAFLRNWKRLRRILPVWKAS